MIINKENAIGGLNIAILYLADKKHYTDAVYIRDLIKLLQREDSEIKNNDGQINVASGTSNINAKMYRF